MKNWLLGIIFAVCASTTCFADSGPFYVSSNGFCNVREIYVTTGGDVYGTEIGCSELRGMPVIGSILTNGGVFTGVFLAYMTGGAQCLANFRADYSIVSACTSGNGVTPSNATTWTLSTVRP